MAVITPKITFKTMNARLYPIVLRVMIQASCVVNRYSKLERPTHLEPQIPRLVEYFFEGKEPDRGEAYSY